jgi:hypothetical protein
VVSATDGTPVATFNKSLHGGWRMSRITELIEALKDADSSVRRITIKKLGIIKDPRVVEPLIAALKDEDINVRSAAAQALVEINPGWRDLLKK